jgi:hypothetical protein
MMVMLVHDDAVSLTVLTNQDQIDQCATLCENDRKRYRSEIPRKLLAKLIDTETTLCTAGAVLANRFERERKKEELLLQCESTTTRDAAVVVIRVLHDDRRADSGLTVFSARIRCNVASVFAT